MGEVTESLLFHYVYNYYHSECGIQGESEFNLKLEH